MTKQFSLNFDWLFSPIKLDQKIDQTFINSMEKVDIPHSNAKFTFNNFNEEDYQIQSIYLKEFSFKKADNRKYFVKFDAVGHEAKVYLNEIFIGSHLGGYTSFELDITSALNNGHNVLKVHVDSSENLNIAPFGKKIDYLTYGGIYREVYIIEKPVNYIKDVEITSKDLLTEPIIQLKALVSGGNKIKVKVYKQSELIYQTTGFANEKIKLDFKVDLWDLENPNLYTIEVWLDELDKYEVTTGFRQIEFKKTGFYLNDKNIKINGLNRHQMYPYVGYAMPKSAQIFDAQLLKETGNAVRTSHYPQSHHFIQTCDELGLLVFTEAPGWQHVGDHAWKENYLEQTKEMIVQYKHHPSIILWGVRVNESGDDHDLYTASNNLARLLDDRPTGGVRCFNYSETLEDVYTYNDFIHNGTNTFLKPIEQVIKTDHPYLITEFMGHMFPTKVFDSPHRMIDHTLRYANILNEVYKNDRIAGAFGWQYIDYYTHKEFGSGDKICYHGVYDIFRLPKPAAKVYQSQVATKPYLEILNYMDIGDYNAGFSDTIYVASNCESIKLYQDSRLVGEFMPNKTEFNHLKHPLYVLDNLYGDVYHEEHISKEELTRLSKIASMVAKRGGLDKILDEENPNWDDINKAWKLYGKYIANWGSNTFTYTLVGVYEGKTITKKVGPYQSYDLDIKADVDDLKIGDTYDVTRIVINATDNLGNIRNYAFDSLMIETNEFIEVIGDKFISLIGGKRAIWIKTKKVGTGLIRFKNDKFDKTITVNVT